jgi:COP9 signalosome complex subunit 6
MGESTEDATMDVHIHPLVVMSLADHYTREKLQNKKDRAVGLLFGKQKGRVVTVFESFELANLDAKTLEEFEKGELPIFKQIYPDYECIGWYSTGDKIREGDKKTHQSITKTVEEEKEGSSDWRSEHPMYVLLDPSPKEDQRDLPLQVFEEAIKIVGDKRTTEFVKSSFRLTSDEAERVTVVHCARVITGDEGKEQSAVTTPYITVKKAITSLSERLRILHRFLEDVQKGKIKADQKNLTAHQSFMPASPYNGYTILSR